MRNTGTGSGAKRSADRLAVAPIDADPGHGFERVEHYRLRVLLHAGGVSWPAVPGRLAPYRVSPSSA